MDDDFSEWFIEADPQPCAVCGKPTGYVEIAFEVPLHPGMQPGGCEGRLHDEWRATELAQRWRMA